MKLATGVGALCLKVALGDTKIHACRAWTNTIKKLYIRKPFGGVPDAARVVFLTCAGLGGVGRPLVVAFLPPPKSCSFCRTLPY